MNHPKMRKTAIAAHILSAIYMEYQGNPRALARDSGASQRAASYWLEGKHTIRAKFLINLMINNERIKEAILQDLVGKLRMRAGSATPSFVKGNYNHADACDQRDP